jgi:hypothetical protein
MTSQQKVQAAIDALPHATGGEWAASEYGSSDVWVRLPVTGVPYPHAIALQYTSGRDGPVLAKEQQAANATLIAASKDLAEEVVRLRALVKEAFGKGFFHGHRDGGCQSWDDVWSISGFPEKISQPLPTPEPD